MLKKIIMIGIVFNGIFNVSYAIIEFEHIGNPTSTGVIETGFQNKPLYEIGRNYRPGEPIVGATVEISGIVHMTENNPTGSNNIMTQLRGRDDILGSGATGIVLQFAGQSDSSSAGGAAVEGLSLTGSTIDYTVTFPGYGPPEAELYALSGSSILIDPGFSYQVVQINYKITLVVTGTAPNTMVLARGNITNANDSSINVEDLVKTFMLREIL